MHQPGPRTLLVGFEKPLNQAAVRAAVDRLRVEGRPLPFLALVSRGDFLEERADLFIREVRDFRELGFATSRGWSFPSRELWERLQPAEAVAMNMMSRTWRRARAGKNHESRKRRWLEWVSHAHGLLVENRIERVLHCNVPHFPFQFVLHEVARALGIETRFLMQLQVRDSFVLAPTIEELHEPVGRVLRGEPGAPALPDAPEPRMVAELERRTTRHRPFYMSGKGLGAWTRFHRAQRRFLRFHLRSLPTALSYWAARRARGGRIEPGTPFVYLPLHLQPEATTLPLGGIYEHQGLTVETLVRALPPGWLLVVKENPKQRFDKRAAAFYRRLASLPSVRLVSRSRNSFDLLTGCRAVATVTGTAGWEALCVGKPTLVLGQAFFRHAPGAHVVGSVEDAREALARISEGRTGGAGPDGAARFLRALQAVSYEGVCDEYYLRDSKRTFEQSVESITEAVLAALVPSTAAEAQGAPEAVHA